MTYMQLSEAIILGDTLKKCDPQTWISEDGSCGCALGGALLATGVTAEQFTSEWPLYEMTEVPCIKLRWPWLTWDILRKITDLYFNVAHGDATIEDVANYVRTIEPPPLTCASAASILDAERLLQVG